MKPIWPKSSPKLVASALSGHSAIGLAVGALMYILCLSGTLAVFYPDTERWEQPSAPEYTSVAPGAVQRTAETMMTVGEKTPANIFVYLPTEDRPRMLAWGGGETMVFDQQGKLLGLENHDFTHFLLNLHIYFHLPSVIGITFVGVLGAMLAGLIISGFIAHPRIFRDAFTFRLGGAKRLSEADLHNRLSVWGAPFHLVIAATGAMLGLSSVLALITATIAFGGDTERLYRPIFGEDVEVANPAPAPLASLPVTLAAFNAAHADLKANFVRISHPGTTAQSLEVQALHRDRLVYGEVYNFTAAGEPIGQLGATTGPIGQRAIAASYPLHFGSFGGGWIRLAYGALGAALSIVTATGINIWLVKRREKNRPAPRLERAWIGVVWGTPATLAAALVAAVSGIAEDTLVPLFWTLMLAIIAASIAARHNQTLSRVLRIATGVLLVAALTIQGAREGSAILAPAYLAVSVGILGLAIAAIASARGLFSGRRASPAMAPAE